MVMWKIYWGNGQFNPILRVFLQIFMMCVVCLFLINFLIRFSYIFRNSADYKIKNFEGVLRYILKRSCHITWQAIINSQAKRNSFILNRNSHKGDGLGLVEILL